jgi:preprotein translocase subunit SecE
VSDTLGSTSMPDRGRPESGGDRGDRADRKGLFARIGLFYRQVVAELHKVIWPTRRELATYTTVVLVFVAGLTAIVAVADALFGRAVLFVFGGSG